LPTSSAGALALLAGVAFDPLSQALSGVLIDISLQGLFAALRPAQCAGGEGLDLLAGLELRKVGRPARGEIGLQAFHLTQFPYPLFAQRWEEGWERPLVEWREALQLRPFAERVGRL
jgi:hypothetical protein